MRTKTIVMLTPVDPMKVGASYNGVKLNKNLIEDEEGQTWEVMSAEQTGGGLQMKVVSSGQEFNIFVPEYKIHLRCLEPGELRKLVLLQISCN